MDNLNRGDRVMHRAGDEDGCEGGWKCGTCKAEITELPFAPDKNRLDGLLCKNCFRDKKNGYNSFRRAA